jgi:cytochrome c5
MPIKVPGEETGNPLAAADSVAHPFLKEHAMKIYTALLVVALVGCKGGSHAATTPPTTTPPTTTPPTTPPPTTTPPPPAVDPVTTDSLALIEEGRQTFRHETFGDEDFWGGTIGLHKALEGAAKGGVGAGVSPKTALAVGLKVDVDLLPQTVKDGIVNGTVSLDDPATTLALLDLDAVVGVKGFSDGAGGLKSVGVTCALCHSTVDNSFAPGVGHRLDGWANRDLDVGTVINLAPDLSAVATLLGVSETTVRTVLKSWGPGKFDAELFLDGKAFQPNGTTSAAVLIPPAFGLDGVNLHTWTGWGSLTYWNAFVAVLEMHGKGNFFDSRLDDATKFPVAARAKMGHTTNATDLVTPKLGALHYYQLSLLAPKAPAASFDAAAATRGQAVFAGAGKCATCHMAPLFTEPGWNMHSGADVGVDDFQASRSPDGKYRTSPLKGLFTHTKGGFYHDGRFATLADVVTHYDTTFSLGLDAAQQSDLVEYLKSL